MVDDDVDCAPTPVVPMTARRKGRFAAMQSLEACSSLHHRLHLITMSCNHNLPLLRCASSVPILDSILRSCMCLLRPCGSVQRLVQALTHLQALSALVLWLIQSLSCRCLPQLCARQQRLALRIPVWLPVQAQLPCHPRRLMHPSGAALPWMWPLKDWIKAHSTSSRHCSPYQVLPANACTTGEAHDLLVLGSRYPGRCYRMHVSPLRNAGLFKGVVCCCRKESGRRKVAFAGEVHTSQTAGSESGVRRSLKAAEKPAAKAPKSTAEAESDQSLHSRSAMSQAIIALSEPRRCSLCYSLIFYTSDDIFL